MNIHFIKHRSLIPISFLLFFYILYIYTSYEHFDELMLTYFKFRNSQHTFLSIEQIYSVFSFPVSYVDLLMLEEFFENVSKESDISLVFFEQRYQILEHDINTSFVQKYGILLECSDKLFGAMYQTEIDNYVTDLDKLIL